ncbi:MAG: hypothetical protein C0467_00530 [Planctomycetaceae bacterium]|nr:hypothetical protein [Planctomycetaceae bacterium]
MQITTVDALIQALHDSKLLSPEQLEVAVQHFAPVRDTFASVLKSLVERKHLSVYQLRKVIHAKAEELFLGPYIIVDKLGEGGMGRVYRARHVRMGREVALKIIRPNLLSNPIIRGRYQREVEAAGTLRHPNIVCVDDAGEANGKYYMAMEFVDGVDLSRLMKDHRTLEITEACEYVRQAALGLQHAHENGFVHRDIKPSNIIVAGERHVAHAKSPAIVKILDMGLVRPLGYEDVPGAAELTRAGTVVGTPDYMAPEQAKNSSCVDARADLYSLGCTLYYLLTAQPPFPDGSPIEKLLKHQLDPAPSARVLRPDIPEAVDAIIACLTAKKPEDRFPSAAAVVQAISPLAVHARGTNAFAVRARPMQPMAVPDATLPSDRNLPPPTPGPGTVATSTPGSRIVPVLTPAPEYSSPQPVAPSDHTPRPPGLPGVIQPILGDPSPFAAIADPPSVPLGLVVTDASAPEHSPPRESSQRMWWIVGGVVALAILAVVVVVVQLGGKPVVPSNPGLANPDPPPPQPKRTGIVPQLGTMPRLHHHSLLIPDGSGLVVVTFPATYLKEKDSPFVKGTGPARLTQWVNRIAADAALDPLHTDRLIVTVPASSSERYFAVTEGDYLSANFTPKLFSLNNPFLKVDRPLKRYVTSAGRHTAVLTPVHGPTVYAVMSNAGFLEDMRPRFATERTPPVPKLDTGMIPALNAVAEKPPLLFAVAGGSYKLPFGEHPTLEEFGIELMTLRVQIAERMEIELTLTGADAEVLKQGVKDLAQLVRGDRHPWSNTVADLVARPGVGDRQDSRFRWTIKTTWTADQFSAFLDQCLSQ